MNQISCSAHSCPAAEVLHLRTRLREEARGQIVHDSIHRRPGWVRTYVLRAGNAEAGFGSVAVGGPWENRPTVYEWYVLPGQRHRAFALFEALLGASQAQFLEVQTSDELLAVMLHAYGRGLASEKIVFRDHLATDLPPPTVSAALRPLSTDEHVLACLEARQGGGEWELVADGRAVGKGGMLFHYNRPYADLFMEIEEPCRRQGFGAWLVQELKRLCYGYGAIPAARCNVYNVASRQTLQKAGFVPWGHIVTAGLAVG